jgi:hypothetical protein
LAAALQYCLCPSSWLPHNSRWESPTDRLQFSNSRDKLPLQPLRAPLVSTVNAKRDEQAIHSYPLPEETANGHPLTNPCPPTDYSIHYRARATAYRGLRYLQYGNSDPNSVELLYRGLATPDSVIKNVLPQEVCYRAEARRRAASPPSESKARYGHLSERGKAIGKS